MESEGLPEGVNFQPLIPLQRTVEQLYKEESVLGDGSYGTVYKAKDLHNPSKYVALKKVKIQTGEDGIPLSILREIAIVRQLDKFQHPNIVRFLDVIHQEGPRPGNNLQIYLVFELVEMDLAQYIRRAGLEDGFSPSKVKDILFQVLCGVDFLHTQRIVHRDLKPQNLLISETGQVKLADFGLAKVYDFKQRLTNVVVTLWYRPPEVLLGAAYGSAVDIWSVGCIFAELIRKKPLLPGTSEKDQLEKTFDLLGTPEDEEWPKDTCVLPQSFYPRPPKNMELLVRGLDPVGLGLLERMLVFDHRKRIGAKEALRHAYFDNRQVPEVELPPMSPSTLPMDYLAINNLNNSAGGALASSATRSSGAPLARNLSAGPAPPVAPPNPSVASLYWLPPTAPTPANDSGYASFNSTRK